MPRSPAFRYHQGSLVQPDQGRPESGLRLPVQHPRGLRDAREEADPLHHVHAHQGHLLCQKILNCPKIFCHLSFKLHIQSQCSFTWIQSLKAALALFTMQWNWITPIPFDQMNILVNLFYQLSIVSVKLSSKIWHCNTKSHLITFERSFLNYLII